MGGFFSKFKLRKATFFLFTGVPWTYFKRCEVESFSKIGKHGWWTHGSDGKLWNADCFKCFISSFSQILFWTLELKHYKLSFVNNNQRFSQFISGLGKSLVHSNYCTVENTQNLKVCVMCDAQNIFAYDDWSLLNLLNISHIF